MPELISVININSTLITKTPCNRESDEYSAQYFNTFSAARGLFVLYSLVRVCNMEQRNAIKCCV